MEKLFVAIIIALAVILLTRKIRNAILKPINDSCGGDCSQCHMCKEEQTMQSSEEDKGN